MKAIFRSYLGITVHWINPQTLQRQQKVLACKQLKGKLTYDKLAKTLQHINLTYGIASKIVSTTTDNDSNFVKAFK